MAGALHLVAAMVVGDPHSRAVLGTAPRTATPGAAAPARNSRITNRPIRTITKVIKSKIKEEAL
jgi:hypothetical protein